MIPHCAIFLMVFLVDGSASSSPQQETLSTEAVDKSEREFAGGPYCGIYSVYCALKSLDIDVPFDKLIQKEYVGSFRGSSLTELTRAVKDLGAEATPLQGLSPAALRLSPCPLILHVKRPGFHLPYSHWILYLGMTEDNKVRIIDPPYAISDLPMADLLALWDGVALAVSQKPISKTMFWLYSCIDQAIALMLGAIIVVLIVKWRWLLKRTVIAIPSIVLMTVLAALLYHYLNDDGIARNASACGLVAGGHIKPNLPNYNINQLKELLANNAVQLLDARGAQAFKAFHLPGAINLPIYAGLAERSEVYNRLPRNRKIVVYCNSENCQWAEIIASDLALRGTLDFALYSGGVSDWIKQTKVSKEESSKK